MFSYVFFCFSVRMIEAHTRKSVAILEDTINFFIYSKKKTTRIRFIDWKYLRQCRSAITILEVDYIRTFYSSMLIINVFYSDEITYIVKIPIG